jgi:peptide/nickel transport system substrate-binding protein
MQVREPGRCTSVARRGGQIVTSDRRVLAVEIVKSDPRVLVVVIVGLLAVACSSRPAEPAAFDASAGPSGGAIPNQALNRPLRIGLLSEPSALGGKFGGGGTGLAEYEFLFAAKLVHYDHLGNPVPVLVAEVPSLERGTWRLLDGGQMETTYRLRRGITWHDGTPFTAEDVRFSWSALMNPELPAENREPEKYIETLEVVSPDTIVARWKEPFIFANAWDLEPLPRHILEPLAAREALAFTNTPFWTREWVGLGPFRLVDWVQGSHIRGQAFPGYALGQPKLQEIVISFIPDSNQAVARMLSDAIDVTLGNLIRVEEAGILKEQLEARGTATVMTIPTKIRYGEFQHRVPSAPQARDMRVRQAMAHGVNRQLLVDTLLHGLTTPADMYLAPNDAAFAAADRAITKYAYDPNRALALLSEAGWTRRDEGLRGPGGEPFELEVRTTEGRQNANEAQILADDWRQLGIVTTVEIIPNAKQNDQEYRAKFPGITASATSISPDWMDKWQTERIASEATRWRGANRGGYSRPELDTLYRDYITTIDPARRQDVLVRLVKFASEDVTYLPLFYQVDVHAIRNGLKGLVPRWPGQSGMAFNAHEWYWES